MTKCCQVDGIIDELTSIVGPRNVSSSQAVREQHGKDESYHSVRSPDLVVWPGCTEEVSNVAKLCNQHKIVMIPFGTGTGMEAGVAALEVNATSTKRPLVELLSSTIISSRVYSLCNLISSLFPYNLNTINFPLSFSKGFFYEAIFHHHLQNVLSFDYVFHLSSSSNLFSFVKMFSRSDIPCICSNQQIRLELFTQPGTS